MKTDKIFLVKGKDWPEAVHEADMYNYYTELTKEEIAILKDSLRFFIKKATPIFLVEKRNLLKKLESV